MEDFYGKKIVKSKKIINNLQIFSNFPQKMLGYRKSKFTIFSIFSRLYVHTQSTQFGQSNFFMRRMKLKVHQLKAGNKQLSLSIVIFHCRHSV